MVIDLAKKKGDLSKLQHLEEIFYAYEKSKCIEEEKGCFCIQTDGK